MRYRPVSRPPSVRVDLVDDLWKLDPFAKRAGTGGQPAGSWRGPSPEFGGGRNKSHGRPAVPEDNESLSALDAIDQLSEPPLRVCNADRLHKIMTVWHIAQIMTEWSASRMGSPPPSAVGAPRFSSVIYI